MSVQGEKELQLSVAVTNAWDNHFIKRKGLFWLSVLKVLVYGRFAPFRWMSGGIVRHAGSTA